MLRCHKVLITVSNGYPFVQGRLPTRYSPVRRFPLTWASEEFFVNFSLDLHVLGTPPAFILSQDQTLENMVYHLSFLRSAALLSQKPMLTCSGMLRFVFARAPCISKEIRRDPPYPFLRSALPLPLFAGSQIRWDKKISDSFQTRCAWITLFLYLRIVLGSLTIISWQ